MKMKFFSSLLVFVSLVLFSMAGFSQTQRDSAKKQDTSRTVTAKPVIQKPRAVNQQITSNPVSPDSGSNGKISANATFGVRGSKDSLLSKTDSITDSSIAVIKPAINYDSIIISKNSYINSTGKPVFFEEQPHAAGGKEFLFYILCIVLLILGLFRTFFTGYFKNLFRVYFNTSLRQTQLSDQLRQATLPSLILNIFFAITAGIYIWLLFNFYHPPKLFKGLVLLPFCILSVATIYFIKFCLLKFLGWVSDVQESTNGYIFAIFLVNKITGIFLVPLVILLAFINPEWLPIVLNISFLLLILLFLSRYVKSYGIIEKKIPLRPFHFLIYIAGAEIIPLFILYKVAMDYLI
ncbi:MAG: DUF4271 domain-containing protein [Ginsengibacter sp.]